MPRLRLDESRDEEMKAASEGRGREEYTLTLDGEEAAWLDELLYHYWRNESGAYLGPGARISDKLNYSQPKFPVGTRVTRISASWDPRIFVVTGHRFVSPSNWTANLVAEDGDTMGVSETYLAELGEYRSNA